MGLLLSRFRKKKTTIQVLDEIDHKIKNIEEFQKKTEQKFRRIIGKLIVSSILIYAIALCGYYYYFSPDTFRENILKFVPLLVFPIVIIVSRKLLSWYYRRKLAKNETTLKTLKKKKVEILDEVSETEKYKQAREIFEKYAPERLNPNLGKSLISNGNSKAMVLQTQTPQAARQRLTQSGLPRRLDMSASTPSSKSAGEIVPFYGGVAQPRLSLPRPILPRDRGPFDKLVDMIIGDGPGNRYALICRMCSSHNGMALKHEFEFIAFRCAYCLQWNPARKQKPHAPHLALDNVSHDESDANNSEPETTDCANLMSESHRTNGGQVIPRKSTFSNNENQKPHLEGKSESPVEKEADESVDSFETLESKETFVCDSVEGKTELFDAQIAAASDDIDLSDVREAIDNLESDTVASKSAEHLESTAPDTSIEGGTR